MRLLSILFLISLCINTSFAQAINYSEIFGDDWIKAETFEKENRIWMEQVLTKNNISYPLAIAVIFPELVRYSALRDKMEISLLKTLYINLGEDYANFSIGQFQMKPSFAERIREQAPSSFQWHSGLTFKSRKEYDNILDFRRSIIKDLEDPEMQMNYLIALIRICEKKFKINRKDEASRVKFLAAAYNFGFENDSAEIESAIDKKYFNTKLFKTKNYSYADISYFWYYNYFFVK